MSPAARRSGAADGPNQKWDVNISYVWTREGQIYLAVVIDLFSRRVVGWSVGDRLHRRLTIAALKTALTMRRPPEVLIHHSDRGSQGGFNRSSQQHGLGGSDENSQTRFGWLHPAQNAFARSATSLAA